MYISVRKINGDWFKGSSKFTTWSLIICIAESGAVKVKENTDASTSSKSK